MFFLRISLSDVQLLEVKISLVLSFLLYQLNLSSYNILNIRKYQCLFCILLKGFALELSAKNSSNKVQRLFFH